MFAADISSSTSSPFSEMIGISMGNCSLSCCTTTQVSSQSACNLTGGCRLHCCMTVLEQTQFACCCIKTVLRFKHVSTFDRSACMQSVVCVETDWLHDGELEEGVKGDPDSTLIPHSSRSRGQNTLPRKQQKEKPAVPRKGEPTDETGLPANVSKALQTMHDCSGEVLILTLLVSISIVKPVTKACRPSSMLTCSPFPSMHLRLSVGGKMAGKPCVPCRASKSCTGSCACTTFPGCCCDATDGCGSV